MSADSSSLLEQAILDAAALKEVAIKNAESNLLEKYAGKIKEAVDSLLEKDEENPLDMGSEDVSAGDELSSDLMSGTEENGGTESAVAENVPLAATEGEKLCQCPDEGETIEIDFDQLEDEMAKQDEIEPTSGEPIEISVGGKKGSEEPEEENEFELDEASLTALVSEVVSEELTVDTKPVKSGWKDSSEAKEKEHLDQILMMQNDDKTKEENEKMKVALQDLQKANGSLQESLSKEQDKNKLLSETKQKYESLLVKAKDTIQEINLTNAVLLYTNKALTDGSLNGRQKNLFVESLSKAKSIDEAKVIFETMSNSVGSSVFKKRPQSLNEAASSKNISMFLARNNSKETENNNNHPSKQVERMKILAGINSKKE